MAEGLRTIRTPELSWRRRHDVGEFWHVVEPARERPITKSDTTLVSAKVEQPLLTLDGDEAFVVTDRRRCPHPKGARGVLRNGPEGELEWLSHKLIPSTDPPPAQWKERRAQATKSWEAGIRYVAEDPEDPISKGFRPPQLGALHGLGSHWSSTFSAATVVMPTGTGKTEAALALLIAQARGTLLVVVPNRALRDQTVRKFKTLGLLRELEVVDPHVLNPVVGVLTKRPRTTGDLDIFEDSNVVVATMDAIGYGTALPLASEIAARVDMLVVDEAHHIPAKGWQTFRDAFADKVRVVQFTATPFRRDQKLVEGEVAYEYTLRQAQKAGYFKPIHFDPVFEVDSDDGDKAIAEKAVAKLEADIAGGLDHLLMARCKSIERARGLHALYERIAAKHSPILVHSQEADSAKRIQQLFSRDSRIVVCVDMLGEGFDLPELKVAAVHDMHQSLPVLLQFAGRFVRTAGDTVGDATVIANIADVEVSDALEQLYGDDADWNHLLSELSSQAAREHKALVDFLNESEAIHEESEVPLQSLSSSLLRPKLSAVAYRATSFYPRRFIDAVAKGTEVHSVWLHSDSNTLYFVTRTEPAVPWTRSKEVRDRQWDLFVVHHEPELGLLFINSSDKNSLHKELAAAVSDDEPTLINGDAVFRSLSNVKRLRIPNLGVSRHARRNLRHAQYMGADVKQGLDNAQLVGATKSNLSATGFEEGRPVNLGCSYKGRVWSVKNGVIPELLDWCGHVGRKLVDESINTNEIIDNVMIPEEVAELPDAEVLSLEWPLELLNKPEERVTVRTADNETPLAFTELVFDELRRADSVVAFHVEGPEGRADLELRIGVQAGFEVHQVAGPQANIAFGRTDKPLADYLSDYPPLVRFVDLSELDGHLLVRPKDISELTFPAERFEVWDWTGVNVKTESIWKYGERRENSIQERVAQHFIEGGFDIVFDDDDAGEAADLVCMKAEEDHIRLVLVHCKFTKSPSGERVKDVVEVCSQAVRSAHWLWKFRTLCRHLSKREKDNLAGRGTRFLKGDAQELNKLLRLSRFQEVRGEIVVAQPGVSEASHTPDQVAVLSAAHSFLLDTVGRPLDVICGA